MITILYNKFCFLRTSNAEENEENGVINIEDSDDEKIMKIIMCKKSGLFLPICTIPVDLIDLAR